jgi:hypothetical protein
LRRDFDSKFSGGFHRIPAVKVIDRWMRRLKPCFYGFFFEEIDRVLGMRVERTGWRERRGGTVGAGFTTIKIVVVRAIA